MLQISNITFIEKSVIYVISNLKTEYYLLLRQILQGLLLTIALQSTYNNGRDNRI